MDLKETAKYTLDSMMEKGGDKVSVSIIDTTKYELNLERGEISLLRTTINNSIDISFIKDDKKGSVSINKLEKKDIDIAVDNVIKIAKNSKPDQANDIASFQPSEKFNHGNKVPDRENMYKKLDSFNKIVKKKYPDIILSEAAIDFSTYNKIFLNSNNVEFNVEGGIYTFWAMFNARKGEKVSSFNYSGGASKDLNNDLIDFGSLDTLLSQSVEQLNPTSMEEKFIGDIIVTPDCMNQVLQAMLIPTGEYSLLKGTSIYKEKLNKIIAAEKLTVKSYVDHKDLEMKSFLTSDGFKSENITVIENGILKTFLLSLYGSNKTGYERSKNNGALFVIDPGEKSFKDIIKNVKKGILLSRFSGGYPSENGDVSGVAKNSYYIENGEIKYPISETMISANTAEMLKNIKEISKERLNFGYSIMPWVQIGGITISGGKIKSESEDPSKLSISL